MQGTLACGLHAVTDLNSCAGGIAPESPTRRAVRAGNERLKANRAIELPL